jgi:hypothetical protein
VGANLVDVKNGNLSIALRFHGRFSADDIGQIERKQGQERKKCLSLRDFGLDNGFQWRIENFQIKFNLPEANRHKTNRFEI